LDLIVTSVHSPSDYGEDTEMLHQAPVDKDIAAAAMR
jgi:hypothetical protein